jgi:hypothetical protein
MAEKSNPELDIRIFVGIYSYLKAEQRKPPWGCDNRIIWSVMQSHRTACAVALLFV